MGISSYGQGYDYQDELLRILQMEKDYQARMNSNALDEAFIKDLVDSYISFSGRYPDSEYSQTFLLDAANLCYTSIERPKLSIQILFLLRDRYPETASSAHALFLLGYISHNSLRDVERAQSFYRRFVEEHPDHELAPSARFELWNLGKSNEELLRELLEEE